jgi:hypothetical protein
MSSRLKLLDFEDNKIVSNFEAIAKIKDEFNFPVYIISLIGEARFGKSTLINCFGTVLMNRNINICPVKSTNDHCTIGIDICVVKEELQDYGFMFLDCQGINHMDSSNDAKLLIVPYEISNIIVYNEKDINNSTLKSLEPMLLFEKYIDDTDSKKTDKPILVIRARDYTLDDSIESVLSDVLTSRKDQYESTRIMIKKLFSKIEAVSTDMISRAQLTKFKENDFKSIIDDESTNFKYACNKIIHLATETKLKVINNSFISKFKLIIDQVNNNEKIDYRKLDLLTMHLSIELMTFMKEISDELIKKEYIVELSIDFFSKSKKRVRKFKDVYEKFCRMFDKSNRTITEPYYKDFQKREKELNSNFETCRDGLMDNLFKILNTIFSNYNDDISIFTKSYNRSIKSIEINVKHVIKLIKNEFNQKIVEYPGELTNYVNNEIIEKELHDILQTCYNQHFKDIHLKIKERTNDMMTYLNNEILLLANISESSIDVYKPFLEQPFIKQMYDLFADNWAKRKTEYCYYSLDIEVKNNKLEYKRKYLTDHSVEIILYSNDDGYKSLIKKFIESTEVINKYNSIVTIILDDVLEKDPSIKGKHDIIKANKNIKFYCVDVQSCDFLTNCKDTMIFTQNGFENFIETNFTIVSKYFTLKTILYLFTEKFTINGDEEYDNIEYIMLHARQGITMYSKLHLLQKLKDYHLEQFFTNEIISTDVYL